MVWCDDANRHQLIIIMKCTSFDIKCCWRFQEHSISQWHLNILFLVAKSRNYTSFRPLVKSLHSSTQNKGLAAFYNQIVIIKVYWGGKWKHTSFVSSILYDVPVTCLRSISHQVSGNIGYGCQFLTEIKFKILLMCS